MSFENGKAIRYFSMFTGVGGFELGIQRAYDSESFSKIEQDWKGGDRIIEKQRSLLRTGQHSSLCVGFSRSNRNVRCDCEEKNFSNTEGNKSIPQGQKESDNSTDNFEVRDSKNSDGTLFQNRQQQSNSKSSNMGATQEDVGPGQSIRQTSPGVLREGDGIRDDSESLQHGKDCTNPSKFRCIGFSEIDKFSCQLLRQKFPNIKNYGDATTIVPEDLPDFEFLVGGFPCQAFSIAGKRKGFEDTRGTLFYDIARILQVKRPGYILLENVKGLLNHDGGRTFATILATLSELGYVIQWMVLNSKFFGVPQNRERVFIIGSLRGKRIPEVLPFKKIYGEDNAKMNIEEMESSLEEEGLELTEKGRLSLQQINSGVSDAQRVFNPDGIAPTLKGLGGGQGAKTGLYAVPLKFLSRNQKNFQGKYSFTVDSANTGGIMENVAPCLNPNDLRKGFSGQNKQTMKSTGMIRRLTPTECERLQGFPDGWTKGFSDTQRYKMMGNAVTVNVIHQVMCQLTKSIAREN